jgi:beta-1,4-mannosyl-glycoprotein beta-1,4-N-acetylglucosaminyltransferase
MKKLIDCFTFYNELEMLELRLTELYDVVDKFILIEAEKTFSGNKKSFIYEENKSKFEKWNDKIIHVKISFPSHLDTWGRERFQRNSFMPVLYSLGLLDEDLIVISDIDEIPDFNTLSYIKNEYAMKGIFKLEMDHYWGSLYNKMTNPEKWYHPKILDWGTLKTRNPDDCRLDFNCQWWEKGGWHLSYFGGPKRIVDKIDSFSHQEYNNEKYKDEEKISERIVNGGDFLGESRLFNIIDPSDNQYLPNNWRILLPMEERYERNNGKKNLRSILNNNQIKGFDKNGGTDKDTEHSYIETYEKVLSPYLDKKPSILEIGVQFGGSSLLWHDYFDDSKLVMLDIKDVRGSNIVDKMDKNRYKFHILDAYKKESFDKVKEETPDGFDIIMDDGPHTLESQIFFLRNYTKLLKDDGVMIIEDIQSINYANILEELIPDGYKGEIVDLRGIKNRYDDIMLIVRKVEEKIKFTIGWISHNPKSFNKYLSPSLKNLNGNDIDVIPKLSSNPPAKNYNEIIRDSKTKWVILCHEDMAFSSDILDVIRKAIKDNPNVDFFGYVGADKNGTIKADTLTYKRIETTDSCFIVLKSDIKGVYFDEKTFDGLHLYVEDFCTQLGGNGMTILCNYLESDEYEEVISGKTLNSWLHHRSVTYRDLGPSWGDYSKYKKLLNEKWDKFIPTT